MSNRTMQEVINPVISLVKINLQEITSIIVVSNSVYFDGEFTLLDKRFKMNQSLFVHKWRKIMDVRPL
jgi:hypothetical protein